MRIIAGSKKGHKLLGPPEVKIENLKPMPDKVREAIFNILGSWVSGKKVLDLYAGTGAVGLEALSRGALEVDFVELSSETVNIIEKNRDKLGFESEVFQRDASLFVKDSKQKYDLIFITPPHQEISFKVVKNAGQLLKKGGVIVLESDSKEEIPEIDNLKKFDHRVYSKLKISFFEG